MKAVINAVSVYIIIHIINIAVRVAKKIAKTIREITAIIPATRYGHFSKISNIIENIITKSNPIISPSVSIRIPPF